MLNTRPDGLEVSSMTYSINDKALGSGEPIRVRQGQRVLFHFLNASAIENRRIALAGHKMKVIALDGNPVPTPQRVDSIFLGAGERIDAVVEMNHPGVWILGATERPVREAGLGVICRVRRPAPAAAMDRPAEDRPGTTRIFGEANVALSPTPQQTIDMIFEKIPGGAGKFNLFSSTASPIRTNRSSCCKQGTRYRLVMRNRTDDAHPMHLHRHQLGTGRDQRQAHCRRDQGHGRGPLLRPRQSWISPPTSRG